MTLEALFAELQPEECQAQQRKSNGTVTQSKLFVPDSGLRNLCLFLSFVDSDGQVELSRRKLIDSLDWKFSADGMVDLLEANTMNLQRPVAMKVPSVSRDVPFIRREKTDLFEGLARVDIALLAVDIAGDDLDLT